MRWLWPQSLAGRITLLLLGGLSLLHIGSMVVHERALHGAEEGARVTRVADRILAARAALEALPEGARDDAAHGLSTAGLDVHWDRVAPLPGDTPVPAVLSRLATLLGSEARLGWDHKAMPGHQVVGAVPLPAGGWLVFSCAWLGAPLAGPMVTMEGSGLSSMLAMAVGIALASILIIRWITQPLRRLAEAADGIGRDLRARPLPLDGPREVSHAAAAFNAMQDRITRLVEDRTEALAAMSHDLRTPLSRLRLRIGFLPEGEPRDRMEADMAEMATMISRTMDYIREGRDAEPARPADLAAILQTLASDASDAGHDVGYEGPARAVLPLRPLATKRALSNLVENALRHGAGPVRLTIKDEPGQLVAEVSDAGPGIATADRPRAVMPFTQLDASRGNAGAGLGLAIVQRFAEASGGSLSLGDAPGGGLRVRLALPKALTA